MSELSDYKRMIEKPEREAMEAQIKAAGARIEELERELLRAKFAPMGDNHHNALLCPYCSPRLERTALDVSMAELSAAISEYEAKHK